MKPHHIPLLIQALQWVFAKGMQADRAIEQLFKNNELSSLDKRILYENFYDIIRWWRLLTAANNGNESMQDENLARIIGINLVRKDRFIPTHPLLQKLNPISLKKKLEAVCDQPAICHSLPDWIEERCSREVNNWEMMINSLNEEAPLAIRVNTLKSDVSAVQEFFEGIGVVAHRSELTPHGIILEEFVNVYRTHIFREGWIEVQDEGSQKVSEFLDAEPGMRVVDACAGAGGKSLHLASIMQNKGKIIAMDIFVKKLEELKRRSKRAGANNIEVRLIESAKTVKRMNDSADRVLIDAPCSGLGVLRRNPDIKWRLSADEIDQLLLQQQDLLQRFSKLVKKGGKLVYATCSILPEENELQVNKFLENHPFFELESEEHLHPYSHGCDGFYMARMIRKE